jgi:hypothetical protein
MNLFRSVSAARPSKGKARPGRTGNQGHANRPTPRRLGFGFGGLAGRLLPALLLAQLPVTGSLGAAEPGPDLSGIAWSRLLMVATEAASEVSAEVRLSPVPPEDLARQTGRARDAEAMLVTGHVKIKRFDKAFKTEVWFLPRDGAALKRRRLKTGEEPSLQTFWYLADGVRRERSDPDGRRESKLPPDQWTRVREHFYSYGPPRSGCTTLTDPLVLLLIARADTGPGETPRDGLCAFNKKTLYHAAWQAAAARELEVDYKALDGESSSRVKGRVAARRVLLKTRAAYGAGRKPDPFEVFEMTGAIEIWLEESSGLPLQISGQVSGIGKVAFVLKEVTLRR